MNILESKTIYTQPSVPLQAENEPCSGKLVGQRKNRKTVYVVFKSIQKPEPVFVDLLRSSGIDSPASRAGMTTLFVVLARQAT
jgi:hypothetical protein